MLIYALHVRSALHGDFSTDYMFYLACLLLVRYKHVKSAAGHVKRASSWKLIQSLQLQYQTISNSSHTGRCTLR